MSSPQPDNWAVLVSTSKYYYNYRHFGNLLGIYTILKENGFDDDHIILMDSLQVACDPRNPRPGQVFSSVGASGDTSAGERNTYANVETDYKGDEVTVDAFLRVLTGLHEDHTSNQKRMRSSSRSNVLVYLSGHGGEEFFKFRDVEELSATQLKDAIIDMKIRNRFNNLLVVADTCKAATMLDPLSLPAQVSNVTFIASSQANENSYGWVPVPDLDVTVVDRFSMQFSENIKLALQLESQAAKGGKRPAKDVSLHKAVDSIDVRFLNSHASITSNSKKKMSVSSFFSARLTGNISRLSHVALNLDRNVSASSTSRHSYISSGFEKVSYSQFTKIDSSKFYEGINEIKMLLILVVVILLLTK